MKFLLLVLCTIIFIFSDNIASTHYVFHPHEATRKINFQILDKNKNIKVPIYELVDLNLGKKITPSTLFSIGVELNLKIKFLEHESIKKNIVITPGIGDFQIVCNRINKLILCPFVFPKKQLIIDQIKYQYSFWVNEKLIENHLILSKKKGTYTIKANRYTRNIRVICGFYYSDFHTTTRTIQVYSLKNIHIDKYIEHLKKIKHKGALLSKIRRFVKSHKRILIKSGSKEIEMLMEYLESLEVSSRENIYLDDLFLTLEEIIEDTSY